MKISRKTAEEEERRKEFILIDKEDLDIKLLFDLAYKRVKQEALEVMNELNQLDQYYPRCIRIEGECGELCIARSIDDEENLCGSCSTR